MLSALARWFRVQAFLMAVVATFGVVNTAAAQAVPHRESVDGQVTNLTASRLDWVAQGKATHLGLFTVVAGHDYTPLTISSGIVTNGTFKDTAADGSTISGAYTGKYAFISNTLVRFEIQISYCNGTGRLAGVTGTAAAVSILDVTSGQFHYEAVGTFKLR
jgi:predicted TIM-barrel enzyme